MYAFWSFAYNNVFDFLSAIYIPIISDQSKSNTLQKIKFSPSSWLSHIKKRKSLLYNSIVLICSEITSQKKIHLTIFFYLSIKKALEDFLHDNRDSSHKHTEAMRLYAPSLKLLYRFSSPQGDISVLACIYSVPQLPICHLTQKYLSTNIKVAPLTYNIPVSVWKGVIVKECFYLLVQKAAQWLWHQQPVTDWINLFKQLTVHL